jgi:hypothetical protein
MKTPILSEAKRRFDMLILLWSTLFGCGTVVTSAALWHPDAVRLYQAEPFLAFVWLGQALLFSLSLHMARNRLRPYVAMLCGYKVAAGITMLLFTVQSGIGRFGRSVAVGGALLDLSMAAVTFLLWLPTRQVESEAARNLAPRASSAGDSMTPWRVAATAGGLLLAISATGPLLRRLSSLELESELRIVAEGNLVGVYTSLFAGFPFARSPDEKALLRRLLTIANLMVALGLYCWRAKISLPEYLRDLYGLACLLHVTFAVGLGFGNFGRGTRREMRP